MTMTTTRVFSILAVAVILGSQAQGQILDTFDGTFNLGDYTQTEILDNGAAPSGVTSTFSTDANGLILSTTNSANVQQIAFVHNGSCLLYTSPSPRDATLSRMPSSA